MGQGVHQNTNVIFFITFIFGGSQAAFTDCQSCGTRSGSVSSAHTHAHTHTAEKAERSHSVFNPEETQTSVSECLRLICLSVGSYGSPGSLDSVSGASVPLRMDHNPPDGLEARADVCG